MHCRNCGKQIDDKAAVCIGCGVSPRLAKKFCHNCGTATEANHAVCLSCGVALDRAPGQKSKSMATLIGIFAGGVGGHKFYMGSWGWGIIYLIFCWTWIPAIVGIVEWIRYILMTDDEFALKAATFQGSGPFSFFW